MESIQKPYDIPSIWIGNSFNIDTELRQNSFRTDVDLIQNANMVVSESRWMNLELVQNWCRIQYKTYKTQETNLG